MARKGYDAGEGKNRRKYDSGEKSMHSAQRSAKRSFMGEGSGDAPRGSVAEGHDEMRGRDDYAGLPKEVRMELYPKSTRLPKNEGLDDTMSDIDNVCDRSDDKRKSYMSWQK